MKSNAPAPAPRQLLHLEDSDPEAELTRAVLEVEWPSCKITRAKSREDFVAALRGPPFDVIISDFALPGFNGLAALALARRQMPSTPFIFLSGTIGEDNAVEVLKQGATDFVIKDRVARLVPAIRRALDEVNEQRRRLAAEQRLREQAELLDKVRNAIVVSDLAGRVLYWNQGAERLFGWTAAEAMGQVIDRFVSSPTLAALHAARESVALQDEWRGEVPVHDKQGRALVLECHITLVRDDAGVPKARVSISSDITEKKQLEEQFFRAQRLESLGMLAAGISHDLNNVLAPAIMAIPLLRERLVDPRDLRMLEILEKGAERGTGLVRQIMAFAHGSVAERQLLQVRHLLRDVRTLVEETFPKSIGFEYADSPDLWPIIGSATQIHQVLLNLLINARDAMPQGGTLKLRAENLKLDEMGALVIEGSRPGSWIVLHVDDTGEGIPPENVSRIWDPFFTTKEKGKGTGLGLATVRGIVENHGGFIGLQSAPGHGTSFQVYLPAAEGANTKAGDAAAETLPRGKDELVLIVDDESSIRDVTAATLKHYGYRVLTAEDGIDALGRFTPRHSEIRLVITDCAMPSLDGATLARTVRAVNPAVKILAVSGVTDQSPSAGVDASFADRFLSKPFTIEALLTTVDELLHGPGESA